MDTLFPASALMVAHLTLASCISLPAVLTEGTESQIQRRTIEYPKTAMSKMGALLCGAVLKIISKEVDNVWP